MGSLDTFVFRTPRRDVLKTVRKLILRSAPTMVAALACTHCVAEGNDPAGGAPPAMTTEDLSAYVPVTCSGGTIDCKSTMNAGRCADVVNPKCDRLTNECVYRVTTGPGCVCIENDARICNLATGGLGVSLCESQLGPNGTRWGACQPPNTTPSTSTALTAFAPVACPSGDIDCKSSMAGGRCADTLNSRCDPATHECVYPLNITGVGCVCVENTARVCDLGGGVLGVKRCERAGPVGTRWSACQAL